MNIFDLYFSSVVGWQYHPGNRRDGVYLSLDECAQIALQMVRVRNEFLGEEEWHGLQPPQRSVDH